MIALGGPHSTGRCWLASLIENLIAGGMAI
jgi:hypothetical protein